MFAEKVLHLGVPAALVALVLAGCGTEGAGSGNGAPETAGAPRPAATSAASGSLTPEPAGSGASGSADPEEVASGVSGTVTSEDGPVAGAMIQPAPGPGNPAPEREVFVVTTADGAYVLGLSAGRWEITVSAPGYQPEVLDVTVVDGEVLRSDVSLRRDPA